MKNKIFNILGKVDLTLIFILAFIVKILGFGTDFALTSAFFAISGVFCYNQYLKQKKVREINTNALAEVVKKINEMQGAIDSLKIHQGVKFNEKTQIRKF